MIITAKTLITDAMRLVGYIASKETPTADDLQVGLTELQSMMDSWRLEHLLSAYDDVVTTTLPGYSKTLTIGTDLTNNLVTQEFPNQILNVWAVIPGSRTIPIAQAKDVEYWRSMMLIAATSQSPTYFYFDQKYPSGTLTFYPMPAASLQINVSYRVNPPMPNVLSDSLTFSAGWIQALKYNLASNLILPLAVPLGEATSMITAKAAEAKLRVKRNKMSPTPRALIDPTLQMGRYSSGGRRFGYSIDNDSYNGMI